MLFSGNATLSITFCILVHKEYLHPVTMPIGVFPLIVSTVLLWWPSLIFLRSFRAGYNKRERVTKKIISNKDGHLDISFLPFFSANLNKSKEVGILRCVPCRIFFWSHFFSFQVCLILFLCLCSRDVHFHYQHLVCYFIWWVSFPFNLTQMREVTSIKLCIRQLSHKT